MLRRGCGICDDVRYATRLLLSRLAGSEAGNLLGESWPRRRGRQRGTGRGAARHWPRPGRSTGSPPGLVGVEEKPACHGGICEVSADRFSRKDRALMLGLADRLELVTASCSAPVLAELQHAHAWQGTRRDQVPSPAWSKWAALMSSAPERATRYSNGGT